MPGPAHDMVEGGKGDDTIRGGSGADALMVMQDCSNDIVLDFEANGAAQGAFDHIAFIDILPSQVSVEDAPCGPQSSIKHGVKASGMPAWGRSMSNDDIWNLVAFLKAMPTLDPATYQQLVDKSAGHSHDPTTEVEANKRRTIDGEGVSAGAHHKVP